MMAAAAALLATSSLAQALTLECNIPSTNSGGGYVTELYVFEFNEQTGEALVADGWIMHVHDTPIAAKVSDNSKKKLALSWNLVITNSSGQQTKMQYRAAYYKETKEVVVRATPGGGYGGSFEGRGKCKTL
ncbi:MAG: hypothetical protein MUE52_08145 [Tabrizicola sp.]|jgi:hypothetical protein|nr:hypothetical protein [Tabrizicola sp.]